MTGASLGLILTLLEPAQPDYSPTSSKAPASETKPDYAPTSSKAPPSETKPDYAPTSSKAPASDGPDYAPTSSKAPAADPVPESQPEPEPAYDEPEPLSEAKEPEPKFNRHGVGGRAGIVIVPTWILARWVETQTNALCRGDSIGNYAREKGLLRTDGCNFYAGGEYVYRYSRILDIVGAVGYMSAKLPEGYWLDKARYIGTPESLLSADYTEVDLGMVFIQADFIARAPIVKGKNIELGIGGGGGLGIGIITGDIYRTAIGSNPNGYVPGQGATATDTCQTPADLADFNRCTPRYDVNEDSDNIPPNPEDLDDPNNELYASCDENGCSKSDLAAFGYRNASGTVPPVIPVVNLILSARMIIKDTVGITINGGFNTGFYFGGSLTYFFGKDFQSR